MSENQADKRPTIPVLREEPNGFYYAFWSEGRRSRRKSMGTKDQAVATARFAQWLLIDGAGKGNEVDYTVADCWLVYDTKHVQTDAVMPNGKVTIAARGSTWSPPSASCWCRRSTRGRSTNTSRTAAGRRAPATVRIEISYLLAALKFCATSKGGKLISKADIEDIELPPNSPPRDRWLTMDEVQKLLDAAATFRLADGRLTRTERFLWLALFTAAREEALLQLTWDRVDFTTNTIHLNVPGRRITKKRRADVTIATQLRPVLERAYDERGNDLVLDNERSVFDYIQRVAVRAGLAERKVTDERASSCRRGSARTSCGTRRRPTWPAAACRCG
jgi:hypothetical protein